MYSHIEQMHFIGILKKELNDMNNTYKKLITLRNERLYPDGVPLEEGCIVVIKNKKHPQVRNLEEKITHFGSINYFYTHNSSLNNDSFSITDVSEILGKDVSLREVLLLLAKKATFSCAIHSKAKYAPHEDLYIHDTELKIPLNQDPKDYPEELLEQLIEILS